MSVLSSRLRVVANGGLMFYCPGCCCNHIVWYGEGKQPRWSWNGDVINPTFSPSILVRHVPGSVIPGGPAFGEMVTCHSFIKEGFIQYLGDCTHAMANKTVPMVAKFEVDQKINP